MEADGWARISTYTPRGGVRRRALHRRRQWTYHWGRHNARPLRRLLDDMDTLLDELSEANRRIRKLEDAVARAQAALAVVELSDAE